MSAVIISNIAMGFKPIAMTKPLPSMRFTAAVSSQLTDAEASAIPTTIYAITDPAVSYSDGFQINGVRNNKNLRHAELVSLLSGKKQTALKIMLS
jgi:hypothetical protein